MRSLVILSALWFAACASAQCPPSASAGWGAKVTVQFAPSAPPASCSPAPMAVPPWTPPSAYAAPMYYPVPVGVPVYAVPTGPRVEYRIGPFGRVRRVIVGG